MVHLKAGSEWMKWEQYIAELWGSLRGFSMDFDFWMELWVDLSSQHGGLPTPNLINGSNS